MVFPEVISPPLDLLGLVRKPEHIGSVNRPDSCVKSTRPRSSGTFFEEGKHTVSVQKSQDPGWFICAKQAGYWPGLVMDNAEGLIGKQYTMILTHCNRMLCKYFCTAKIPSWTWYLWTMFECSNKLWESIFFKDLMMCSSLWVTLEQHFSVGDHMLLCRYPGLFQGDYKWEIREGKGAITWK